MQTRRTLIKTATVAVALATMSGLAVAKDDIVIGSTMPITGVFAFAGVGINQGFDDYWKWRNANGGIDGRKVKYVFEDDAYKVDRGVANYKKIVAEHNPNLFFAANTALFKSLKDEVGKQDRMLMGGTSYASEIGDEAAYPRSFIAGPTYTQMAVILLKHAAKEKPGAKVVIVHSDTGFGRDPVANAEAAAKSLGLEHAATIATKPGGVDITVEVAKIRRLRPDYILFHGYVLSPLPEFMAQIRKLGLKSKFMGTFWSSSQLMISKGGEAADGYLGVAPFPYSDDMTAKGPAIDGMREFAKANAPEDKQDRSTFYVAGWFTAHLFGEIIKRTAESGKALTATNMKAALNGITDWTAGGFFSTPVTFSNNSLPYGRIYRLDRAEKKYVPVTDWIKAD